MKGIRLEAASRGGVAREVARTSLRPNGRDIVQINAQNRMLLLPGIDETAKHYKTRPETSFCDL